MPDFSVSRLAGALVAAVVFASHPNAETVTATDLVIDLPPGWVSAGGAARDVVRLRFPSDPVEAMVQVQRLPPVETGQLEGLARHMLEAGVRLHGEDTRRKGLTLREVETSIQATSDGWRLTMTGRDDTPRQFAQVSLITTRKMTVLYAQSITHNPNQLIAYVDQLAQGIQREP